MQRKQKWSQGLQMKVTVNLHLYDKHAYDAE